MMPKGFVQVGKGIIDDVNKTKHTTYSSEKIEELIGNADAKLEEDIASNVTVGAANAGTLFKKGLTFTEFAKMILIKAIPPTITFTSQVSGLYEVGTTLTGGSLLTLNITNIGNLAITDIVFIKDGTDLDTQPYVVGTNTYTYQYATDISTDTVFKVRVNYTNKDGSTGYVEQTKEIKFVYASYYGLVTDLVLDETKVKALSKNIKDTKAYTYNSITASDERIAYAYPSSYGNLTSIKDANNFEYLGSYTFTTLTVDGQNYNLYVLTDPTTVMNFRQIYN